MSFHASVGDLLSIEELEEGDDHDGSAELELYQRPASTPPRLSVHPPAPPLQDAADLQDQQVVPSLRSEDLVGRVRSYQGLLSRRNTKGRRRGWSKSWFKVAPGRNQPHTYYLTQSMSTPKERTDLEKRLIAIPKSNPNLQVEPLSSNPLSQDFTGFSVSNSKTGEVLATFRADDIVQQRNFMAALGGKGMGLFTPGAEDVDSNISDDRMTTPNAYIGSPRKFDKWTKIVDKKQIPSYKYTMEKMSSEYYLPEFINGATSRVGLPPSSSKALPIYDVSNPPTKPKKRELLRREETDTFLPPHGPPVCSIVSLGYGKEVDLEPHQQAVWCMEKDVHYCLDHVKKSTFIKEPKSLPAPREVVSKREVSCKCLPSTNIGPLNLPINSACVKDAGGRALRKPHGLVVDASGTAGETGTSGQKGKNGIKGDGEDYREDDRDGRSGSYGEQGTDGAAGTDGTSGRNLIVNLSGDAAHLDLSIPGYSSCVAKLGGETCEEVVFLNCRGGEGGDGGDGGAGGDGGDGEDGEKGDRQNDGGHGGDGGAGGQGGKGGCGGSAGSGGQCVIQTTDSRLLMLIEADCRAGRNGDGGLGGRGGEGGKRGFGGEEGKWEEFDQTQSGVVTTSGIPGKPGMAGYSGADGERGSSGTAGREGAILWAVKDTNGQIVCSSDTRYDAEVTSIDVSSPHGNDTTFEPNQMLNISSVTIVNCGGLPLPAGAVLSFPSTDTVVFESTTFTLPEIAVNETFIVPTTFSGRVVDTASPNSPGPLSSEAMFSSQIDLLGRPFEKSKLEHKLTISHPLNISFALSQGTVSRGEVTSLEIGIENTSRHSYGCLSGVSDGSAWVQVHLDSRLIPLGVLTSTCSTSTSTNTQQDYPHTTESSLPYHVTFDPQTPDSMYIKIKEINPGEVMIIPIAIQMESYAELYDVCVWQTDLWLRGKLIEYKTQEIRVSPAYSPPSYRSQLGDVLMIVNDKIKTDEFQFWNRIFELLGMSVDYWDAGFKREEESSTQNEQQQSSLTNSPEHNSQQHNEEERQESLLSPPPQSSPSPTPQQQESKFPQLKDMYTGKMILYPHCTLEDVPVDAILSHFHGHAHQTGHYSDLNSSMLLFLDPVFPESLEFYTYQSKGHSRLLKHLCSSEKNLQLPKDAYTGHHLVAPGLITTSQRSSKHAEKSTMKRLEREIPSQAVILTNSTNNIKHSGLFKYKYGAMHARRCPLLRSCNFQCVDGAHGNLTTMGGDDPLLTVSSQTVPLGSRFGQVMLTVMSGLPLHCKLSILKKLEDKNSSDYIEFYLPNGVKLTKSDVAAICIAHEVADELYDCTGELHRMTYVVTDLDLSKALLRNGKRELISEMMDLIKREVTERRKTLNLPPVVQASNKIQELGNSWTMTTEPHPPQTSKKLSHGCSTNNLTTKSAASTKLPPLRCLQDGCRVLRSHQNFVDQDRYNISDPL